MVRIHVSTTVGTGSNPSCGNKILYAARYDQKSFKIHNERKNINWDRLLEREFDRMKFSPMKILNAYTLWLTNSNSISRNLFCKNIQIYTKIHYNIWTVNFQKFKLVLEKAEEPEIKLPTFVGSSKKQESSRKTSIFALLTMPKPLTVWFTINCGKFWMRWEYQTSCLLRNLYAGQEATVRTGHEPTDWFQLGKGVCQGCILSLCLFNLYAEYIMRNTGLDEAQAGIKIAGRNINNLRYADDTTLMAESEELKSPWWR